MKSVSSSLKTALAMAIFVFTPSASSQVELIDKNDGTGNLSVTIEPREPVTNELSSDNAATVAPRVRTHEQLNATSGTASKAIVVLDASGSMWGQIDDVSKIDAARDVLSDVLSGWDLEHELGLVAYGHREKDDCNDIETLIPVGDLDKQHFANVVSNVEPKGKTPMTKAVIQAAEELKYTENKATVILISDGIENCGLDPCGIGHSLEQRGVDFTAHVVSFDIPELQTAGLRCLADSTGGRFIQAKDASELKTAFAQAVAVTTQTAAPLPVEVERASISPPKQVVAGAAFEIHWSGPKNRLDRLVIFKTDDPQQKQYDFAPVYRDTDTSPSVLTAPEEPGNYEVRYYTRGNNTLAKIPIVVTPATATVTAPDTVMAGSRFEASWSGPKNRRDRLVIFAANDTATKEYAQALVYRATDSSPAELRAPEAPGEYEVHYYTHGKRTLARGRFTVIEAHASVSAPETVVAGAAFPIDWSGPRNALDRLAIFNLEGGGTFDSQRIRDRVASPTELTAPEQPGVYSIRYLTAEKNTLAKTTFTVVAARASVAAPPSVVAGATFDVQWTGPKNRRDKLVIFSADGDKRHKSTSIYRERDESPTSFDAPEEPGEYVVHYYTQKNKSLARAVITVVPAEAKVLAPQQVTAGAKFEVTWHGPQNKGDVIRILSTNGEEHYDTARIYKASSPTTLEAPEEPGEYAVRYHTRRQNTLAEVLIQVIPADARISTSE